MQGYRECDAIWMIQVLKTHRKIGLNESSFLRKVRFLLLFTSITATKTLKFITSPHDFIFRHSRSVDETGQTWSIPCRLFLSFSLDTLQIEITVHAVEKPLLLVTNRFDLLVTTSHN